MLSLWRDNVCAGTFRLAADEVPDLIALLRRGLDEAYDAARERAERRRRAPEAGSRPAERRRPESPFPAANPRLARLSANLRIRLESARYRHIVDPIRNPYAPGAGQRPPELAGRDEQLAAFDVVLERVASGRPERSLVLTGLRGVGKTVLLNALRGAAVRARAGGPASSRPGPTRGCAVR